MTHPYATHDYAQSLGGATRVLDVPEWGCSVLVKAMLGGREDAAGTYPITVLSADADLSGGLSRLRSSGLVSVVMVTDDFHRPPIARMEEAFDFVRPFKVHYLHRPAPGRPNYSKHHRHEIRRAGHFVEAGPILLAEHLDEWCALYRNLTKRHDLAGVHHLPREHHRTLAGLPGVIAIGASIDRELVSCHVWVSDRRRVHSHLAATSERGYACGASYAVYDASISHFAAAEFLNLGGVAGQTERPDDGLARFKRGFSNDAARSFICGKILDAAGYAELARRYGADLDDPYFPVYRSPRNNPVST